VAVVVFAEKYNLPLLIVKLKGSSFPPLTIFDICVALFVVVSKTNNFVKPDEFILEKYNLLLYETIFVLVTS
jgi:hypothetical protein